jgi:hypothetical protein
MAANPSIAYPNNVPDTEQAVSGESRSNWESLLERSEEVLRKAFGDDEKTIANSLRGL